MNEYFSARRAALDATLRTVMSSSTIPQPLRVPAERAASSRGKRLRGLLTIAVGEAFGGDAPALMKGAAAIEMVHTSSLVIDDLPALDDATLRRGEPTLHRAHGEDLAILTAIGLLNQAYGVLTEAWRLARPRRWPLDAVVERMVQAVGWDGSVGGEAVDLHSDGATLDFATLEYIHSRKTGALFVAAASIGAMLANVRERPLRAVENYAKNLGLAFQIADDVLDVIGTTDSLGKDTGKDADRLTFVRMAGVDGARVLCRELVETAVVAIEPLGRKGAQLREIAAMVIPG